MKADALTRKVEAVLAGLPPKVDGRRAKGAQTRAVLVAATRDLIFAGVMRPRAASIARLSGVSMRCLFQHFADIASLHREALADEAVARRVVARVMAADGIVAQARAIVCGWPEPVHGPVHGGAA